VRRSLISVRYFRSRSKFRDVRRKIAVAFCGFSPTPAPHISFGHPGFAGLHGERGSIQVAERGRWGPFDRSGLMCMASMTLMEITQPKEGGHVNERWSAVADAAYRGVLISGSAST
jgi:hypothetical protein